MAEVSTLQMPSQLAHERVKRCMQEGVAETWVPKELAFEEIIKKNTLPPCSLDDFMDYLMHVEHKAEYLQFFLWFIDYAERWANLCPKSRELSPRWDYPESEIPAADSTIAPDTTQPSELRRQTTVKLNKMLSILEEDGDRERTMSIETRTDLSFSPVASERRNHTRRPSVSSSKPLPTPPSRRPSASRRPAAPLGTSMSMREVTSSCNATTTFTIQPCRDELSRVVRHYIHPISDATPRPLHLLSPQARTAIHKAVHQTTHPSTLIPAIEVAESVVRQAHPHFVKWGMRNANTPRLKFWAILGAAEILIGAAIVVICIELVSSNTTVWHWALRATVACLFWWPGFLFIFASLAGLCFVRFLRGTRDARPWEIINPCPSTAKTLSDDDVSEIVDLEKGLGSLRKSSVLGHSRAQSSSQISVLSDDTLRKPSMQTFGPSNSTEGDSDGWDRMSLWRRISPPEVDISGGDGFQVRRMQRKALVYSGLWALLATGLLVTGSAFLPATTASRH